MRLDHAEGMVNRCVVVETVGSGITACEKHAVWCASEIYPDLKVSRLQCLKQGLEDWRPRSQQFPDLKVSRLQCLKQGLEDCPLSPARARLSK